MASSVPDVWNNQMFTTAIADMLMVLMKHVLFAA